MTVQGDWRVANSFDFNTPDAEETLGTFSAPTWRTGRASFTGDSSIFRCGSTRRVQVRRRCPTLLCITDWPTMKHDLIQFELDLSPLIDNANYNDLLFLAMNLRPEDTLELSVTRDLDDYNGLAWAGAYSAGARSRSGIEGRFCLWRDADREQPQRPSLGLRLCPRRPRPQARDALHQTYYDPGNSFIWSSRSTGCLPPGQRHVAPLAAILGLQPKATITGVGPRKQDMLLFTVSADDLAGRSPVQIAA